LLRGIDSSLLESCDPSAQVSSKPGEVQPFDGLQGGQGGIHPLIGQMIQNGVGFLAGRHGF